jgi:hypothetical protein
MLDNLILNQPFPAIVAFFLTIGIFFLGNKLATIYFKRLPSIAEAFSGYAALVLIIGYLSDIALLGILSFRILSTFALLIGLLGLYQLIKWLPNIKHLKIYGNQLNLVNKIEISLISIILFSLLLSTFGPPTDADSLDYHLGVPANWLVFQSYLPMESWYHARFAGLGERIIFFGLLNGTDVISSVIQWSGLLISIVALFNASKKKSIDDLILSSYLVISPPVILFLVLNQKPYLFPASIILLGVSLLLDDSYRPERKMFLAVFLILSAVLFKYSFLISVFSIFFLVIYLAVKKAMLGKLIKFSLVFFVAFLMPYYIRNYIHFSDPVSPLLSTYISSSSESLINFTSYLKQGYHPNFENIIRMPFDQGIFPKRIELLSTVVGIGGIGILASFFSATIKSRILLVSFTLSFILVVIFGRPISRLMFEIYLLGGMALVVSNLNSFKMILVRLLSFQTIGILLLSLYSLYTIFPGSLSDSKRLEVMSKMADGYSISILLDEILPNNAVILTDLRSKVLLPRRVVFADNFIYSQRSNEVEEMILREDKKHKITHVVLKAPWPNKFDALVNCSVDRDLTYYDVDKATRNPLNKRKYQIVVLRLDKKDNCFLNKKS